MKKITYYTTILFVISITVIPVFFSCDDSGLEPTNSEIPKFTFVTGSTFKYANDTINQGGTSFPTDIETRDSNIGIKSIAGYNAVTILSRNYQNNIQITPEDTNYVRYDSSAGKFYQYGIMKLIDPAKPKTWNLIADFSISTGQEWTVDTTTVVYGTFTVKITLKSKVVGKTTIMTRSVPSQSISCYQIEIKGETNSSCGSLGTVYMDYYIGYTGGTNACLAELKLRPFTLACGPITVLTQSGGDRILKTFVIP